LASARARRLAFGLPDDSGRWLCADPVQLAFTERQARIADPHKLALETAEASALAAAIGPLLAEFGRLELARPDAWHLCLHDHIAAPAAAPLPECIGRRADEQLASLDRHWRQALNEVQMCLHSHPVNQSREANGQAVVNSLWFWGAGDLPPRPATPPPAGSLYCNDADLIGLASHLGVAADRLPQAFDQRLAGPAVLAVDALDLPARQGDAQTWRARLVELDRGWFAPLHDALRRGRIGTLRLEFCGDAHGLAVDCSRLALWFDGLRFWRPATARGRLAPRLDIASRRPA
jgi:hypothetical protein